MSDVPDVPSELSLASDEDLVEELARRWPHLVVAGVRDSNRAGTESRMLAWEGSAIQIAGLCTVVSCLVSADLRDLEDKEEEGEEGSEGSDL